MNNFNRNVIKDIKKESKREYADEEKLKREKEAYAWKVILYNDDIHKYGYDICKKEKY